MTLQEAGLEQEQDSIEIGQVKRLDIRGAGLFLFAHPPAEVLREVGLDERSIELIENIRAEQEKVVDLAPAKITGSVVGRELREPDFWAGAMESQGERLLSLDGGEWNSLVRDLMPKDGADLGDGFELHWHHQPAKGVATLAANDEEYRHLANFGFAFDRHIPLFTHDSQGRWCGVTLTEDIKIPVLRQRKAFVSELEPEEFQVWMSLTPMEFATCSGGVQQAHGKVLMGGLGLGWMAKMIAEKPDVTKVTVIESHPGIAKAFDPGHPKVEVIIGDANDHGLRLYLEHDFLAWDIWPSYGLAEGDERWQALKFKAEQAGKGTWQWCRDYTPEGDSMPQLWWWGMDESIFRERFAILG